MWVRTLKLFLMRVPQTEQSCVVYFGGIAIFAFRGDMVDLDLITILEEKFTPSAFSLLFL
jgi:hypothetical protein